MATPKPPEKVLEWEDLTPHQQMIVLEGRKPGILVPDTIRTAEQYADWMAEQMEQC